jgi:phosphonate metabolism protein (transferase hexapeptide repeat family)
MRVQQNIKALSHRPYINGTANVVDCNLGRFTVVGPFTLIQESSLDDYSYIMGNGNVIYSHIGKFCSIAAMVRINPGNHPMHRATQHHFTYRSEQFGLGPDDPEVFDSRREKAVTIGHDVWIGHGAVVLPGVNIGTGAVVGAGAVVSKDVAPYTIVAGVPAKPIRLRFPRSAQKALLKLQWWNWTDDQLKTALPDFRQLDIDAFITKYAGAPIMCGSQRHP